MSYIPRPGTLVERIWRACEGRMISVSSLAAEFDATIGCIESALRTLCRYGFVAPVPGPDLELWRAARRPPPIEALADDEDDDDELRVRRRIVPAAEAGPPPMCRAPRSVFEVAR